MLEKRLKDYSRSGVYPFHMPGHKRQLDFPNPYSIDITEIDGFDNLHHAQGDLAEIQQKAARLYGADRSYVLVNGSTCGILAAVSAVVPKGASVLVARNCHKSVYHALELRNAKPIYLYPVQTDAGIAGQIDVHEVEELLYGQIAAVIITSPTYDGVVSDIRQIADAAHRAGVPLLVDAAHGAHFGFSDAFPESPLRAGADAMVVSIHKTLPAFTQTALLHLKGERISPERVEEYLDIYETSSPSYVLMAGADRCMEIVASDGKRLLDKLAARLDDFYDRMRHLQMLYVPGRSAFRGPGEGKAYDFDQSKILIFTDRAGISGMQLSDILRTEYGLEMEMSCANYVLALATLMDTEEGFCRLGDALLAIDAGLAAIEERHSSHGEQKADSNALRQMNTTHLQTISRFQRFDALQQAGGLRKQVFGVDHRYIEQVMSVSDAREACRKKAGIEQARGFISASYLIPYPPGIPLVVPGERIDAQTIADINRCRSMGITVEGLMDDNTLMVVSESVNARREYGRLLRHHWT